MSSKLIIQAITMLLTLLTPELLKKMADMVLDFIEDQVKGSASTVDDAIILPICNTIRAAFGIADND